MRTIIDAGLLIFAEKICLFADFVLISSSETIKTTRKQPPLPDITF